MSACVCCSRAAYFLSISFEMFVLYPNKCWQIRALNVKYHVLILHGYERVCLKWHLLLSLSMELILNWSILKTAISVSRFLSVSHENWLGFFQWAFLLLFANTVNGMNIYVQTCSKSFILKWNNCFKILLKSNLYVHYKLFSFCFVYHMNIKPCKHTYIYAHRT